MDALRTRRLTRVRGFALLETLVALVILAVGMLGGVALLIQGLRESRHALHRTLATTLAADLGERIRANRAAGAAYALGLGSIAPAPEQTCELAEPCDAEARATLDLHEWQQRVAESLPDARVSVSVVPVAGAATNTFTIRIRWVVIADAGPDEFSLRVQA